MEKQVVTSLLRCVINVRSLVDGEGSEAEIM